VLLEDELGFHWERNLRIWWEYRKNEQSSKDGEQHGLGDKAAMNPVLVNV
jgi:hypothetical protein